MLTYRNKLWVSKMVQWVEEHSRTLDDMSLIPRTHKQREKGQLLKLVVCLPHVFHGKHGSPFPPINTLKLKNVY